MRRDAETGRRLIIGVIAVMLTVSALTTTAFVAFKGPARLPEQVGRFLLTGALSIYLYRRANWARLVAAICAGWAGLMALGTGVLTVSENIIGLAFIAMGIVYTGTAVILNFSPAVHAYFTPTRVADTFDGVRSMLLNTKPEELGLKPSPDEVWGILMETGHAKAVVSLVTLADGTVSLYFSNGGGIIGLGAHPGPQRKAKEFLARSQKYLPSAASTTNFPLPDPSYTRFYLLTGKGVATVEAKEEDLGHHRHPFSPLFHAGHEVISEIHLVEQALRDRQSIPELVPNETRH